MEKEISKFIAKEIKAQGLSTYYLQQNGVPSTVLNSVLQRKNGNGKTYTLKTLKVVLNALNFNSLELLVDGNSIKIDF